MSGRMWGNALVAAVGLAVLGLGIVTVNSGPDPAPPDVVKATTADLRPYKDDQFLTALGDYVQVVTPAVALGMGHRVCTAFAEGASVDEIRTVLVQKGLPPSNASRVVLAAVSTFCPDYKYQANP
jgi:hypothetical protein